MITSGLLFGLSDLICQKYIKKQKTLDIKRVLKISSMGFVTGAAMHVYF